MRTAVLLIVAAFLLSGCVSDTTNNSTPTPGSTANYGLPVGNDNNSVVVPYDDSQAPGPNEVVDTQQLIFLPPVAMVEKGIVGEHYNHSYCEPELVSASDICAPQGYTGNPSLGNPPYHFQLDSGKGFPPMGLTLHPNGIVDGIPATEGVSNFTVCAIDQSGAQACAPESIEVVTAKATFDSLTCRPDQSFSGGHGKYYILATGTATAPVYFTFHYHDNMDELNDRNPGANIYEGGSEKESTCGTWTGNNNVYCTNSNDIPLTSWVASYYIFSPLNPTVINASINVDADGSGGYYSPVHTTTIWKTVTCG